MLPGSVSLCIENHGHDAMLIAERRFFLKHLPACHRDSVERSLNVFSSVKPNGYSQGLC